MSIVQILVFAVIAIGFASLVSSIALLAYLIVLDYQQARQHRAALRQFDDRYALLIAEATREWEGLR